MDDRSFLIVGGGIAGLAAGLGLARIGRGARIFEQAAAFEEVGAGLQMSPNAVRALRWLGAWDAVEPQCVSPTEIHIRDGLSGRLMLRIPLGNNFERRFAAPYRVLHRADLLGGLVAAARASKTIDLRVSSPVISAESTPDGARLTVPDGPVEGGGVIAADGIRSVIRKQIAADGEPVTRGQAIFRSLIPFAGVPPAIASDCVTLWLCPGGHAVHYPVSNWRQFNIVVAIDSTWTSPGWSEPGRADDLRAVFRNAVPALADLLEAPASWLKWAGADREPIETWTHGRMALIGDAAHAALPYLAQGAAMALEDACVIAREIGLEPDVPTAFTRFAAARRQRTAHIQARSRKLPAVYHAYGLRRMARNLLIEAIPPERFMERLRWIYNWDVMQ